MRGALEGGHIPEVGKMGYLGAQLLRGLERFPWYETGTPGVEINEVGGGRGMQGLLQGAGWRLGSFREQNPPWEQISVNFGEMQLKGEEGPLGSGEK